MRLNVVLWIVQGLLAALFLFAGGMKLVMPIAAMQASLEAMKSPIPLPGLFLQFVGVMEVLGAIGLILPGLLRIRPDLTPLAACGLGVIMIGATAVTATGINPVSALFPLITGLLAAWVAYARWPLVLQHHRALVSRA